MAAGEDGTGVEVVRALALLAPIIDQAALAGARLSCVLGLGTTAGTAQPLRVEIFLHPLDALPFIEQLSYREDHARSVTCANRLHEPLFVGCNGLRNRTLKV